MAAEPTLQERTTTVRQALADAVAHFQASRLDEAAALCRQILAARPQSHPALQLLGLIEHRHERHDAGATLLRQALALEPGQAEYHCNLGVVLQAAGQTEQALTHYRQALARRFDYPEAFSNLGTALGALGHLEEAVAAFRQALALKPAYVEAYHNLGRTYQDVNRTVDALAAFRQALAVDPSHADARWGTAWVHLVTGNYAEGWAAYEGRFETTSGKRWGGARKFAQPRWAGEPLAGRTLLVHCEQGLGDTLQFCRFLPLVQRLGGPVIFECQGELHRLLGRLPGLTRVVARPGDVQSPPPVAFDTYVPLLSLPHLLGTTLATIPASVPYVTVEPERVRAWRPHLAGPGLKVGLVWAGNPRNPLDRHRSCPAAALAALAGIDGVRYFSLQKGPAAATPPDLPLTDLGGRLRDFTDTAAVLLQLDLVISVDTAVAHLAGALGRPAWVLLPFAPDWRWLLERTDSPWYPTLCLFRQERRGDWPGLLTRVAAALRSWVGQRLPAAPALGQEGTAAVPTAEELMQQGVTAWQQGRREEGLTLLQQAAAVAPERREVHYNLAVVLNEGGRPDEAADHYRRALALAPATPEVHFNLANLLRDRGRLDQAVLHYRQAVALQPDYRKAHTNLAGVLAKQEALAEAVVHYRQALALDPARATAHLNLGTTLHRLGEREEAAACLRQALALDARLADAHARLGVVLDELGQAEAGIGHLQQALALRPTAPLHHNLAMLRLRRHGPSPEVIDHFQQALALEPDWAEGHHSLAKALLASGEWKRGFAEYEWRWRVPGNRPLPVHGRPWDGTPCPGQTVLLWTEQGLGDTLHFIRYAAVAAARAGRVVLGCPVELVRLLATAPGIAQVAHRLEDLPACAYHAPLLSLPHRLDCATEPLPTPVPYLRPPPDATVALQVPPATRLKVGLVWAGNPAHAGDADRSCPAAVFAPLHAVPGVACWSLQKDAPAADLPQLDPAGQGVQDLAGQLSDFGATAAAVAQLDLVISVDTAVAHLAGALGKPVWVILPSVPDWRWQWGREDTPWYPTMRLFRQRQPGDWAEVLTRVAAALQRAVEVGSAAQTPEPR